MIPRKLKRCKGCGKDRYIFSHGNCKDCHNRLKMAEKPKETKPRTQIKPVSDKQSKINAAYKILRDKFMANNKLCQAQWEGCTTWATECHHALGRLGGNMLNDSTYRALCHNCHGKVETDKPRALKEGLSGNRLDKP